MKKVILVFLAAVTGLMATAQTAVEPAVTVPETLQLKENSFDFGKIRQGRPVTHEFVITNTGKEALRLENVMASCGCTTPEWSREPIQPGASSTIKVGYNALAEGAFNKSVTIAYNGNKTKTIIISGNVFKAPATSAPPNASLTLLKNN